MGLLVCCEICDCEDDTDEMLVAIGCDDHQPTGGYVCTGCATDEEKRDTE